VSHVSSEIGQSSIIIDRYKRFSLQFYKILMSYAEDMQAVSVDEALIDVSSTVENARRHAATVNRVAIRPPDFAKELAETIRAKIRNATGCEGARVSIFG
jgi:DNA repair protein REV1